MATFIGTKREFNDYLGPRIRNIIQKLNLTERGNRHKTCERCNKTNVELESAHIHGKERKRIVEFVLNQYFDKDQIVIDIKKVEDEIKKAHLPLHETFLFLCRNCHAEYDAHYHYQMGPLDKKISDVKQVSLQDEEVQEVYKVEKRIVRWFNNKDQINSKILYTFLELRGNEGKVNIDTLKRETRLGYRFESNFTQMRIIAPHNHAKVFDYDGNSVWLWDKVKDLVLLEYKKHQQ